MPDELTSQGNDALTLARREVDHRVSLTIRDAGRRGRTVTCRPGCAACCRQLVPVSTAEIHDLRQLVETWPIRRREALRSRAAAVRRALASAGLLELLEDPLGIPAGGHEALGRQYLEADIMCPFLEGQNTCGIYAHRPIACRAHLVTSPSQWCENGGGRVLPVELPPGVFPPDEGQGWQVLSLVRF